MNTINVTYFCNGNAACCELKKVSMIDNTGSVLSESVLETCFVPDMADSHSSRAYEQKIYTGNVAFLGIEVKQNMGRKYGKLSNFSVSGLPEFNPTHSEFFYHNGVKCDSLFKALLVDGMKNPADIDKLWSGEAYKAFNNIVFRGRYLRPEWVADKDIMFLSCVRCLKSMLEADCTENFNLAIKLLNTAGDLVYRPPYGKKYDFFAERLGRLPLVCKDGKVREYGDNILGQAMTFVRESMKESGFYDSFKDKEDWYHTVEEDVQPFWDDKADNDIREVENEALKEVYEFYIDFYETEADFN